MTDALPDRGRGTGSYPRQCRVSDRPHHDGLSTAWSLPGRDRTAAAAGPQRPGGSASRGDPPPGGVPGTERNEVDLMHILCCICKISAAFMQILCRKSKNYAHFMQKNTNLCTVYAL
jgi:hypothetical protein